MNKYIGSLVRRKISNVVGVLMSSTSINTENTEFICEVAFGYLTKSDALASKSITTKWPEIHSSHIELISQ